MPEVRDSEYLSHSLIPDVTFTIESDHIRVASLSTIYAETVLSKPIDKGDLLSLYEKVLRDAKAQKISISYGRHTRKCIQARWKEYESDFAAMKSLFSQITQQCQIVEKRGLHMGTSDDKELERLQDLCYQFQQFTYSCNISSVLYETQSRLKSLHRQLNSDLHQISKIYI